jgi:hypothetical protein
MVSRTELKAAVRNLPIWDEVSKEYRAKLPRASKNGDYAKCLKGLMDKGIAGRDAYKKCAETYKLADILSSVWSD